MIQKLKQTIENSRYTVGQIVIWGAIWLIVTTGIAIIVSQLPNNPKPIDTKMLNPIPSPIKNNGLPRP